MEILLKCVTLLRQFYEIYQVFEAVHTRSSFELNSMRSTLIFSKLFKHDDIELSHVDSLVTSRGLIGDISRSINF